jgi:hypothetical protein
LRLLRSDDVPATNPHNLAYRFGLEDTKGNILPGERQADGIFAFDFNLKVKQGKDATRPVFTGRFASGSVEDRFVYRSWFAAEREDYINRLKVRLGGICRRFIGCAKRERIDNCDLLIQNALCGTDPVPKRLNERIGLFSPVEE